VKAAVLVPMRQARSVTTWLPVLVVLGSVFWLLRDTAQAMVSIWSRSDTFMHGFVVPVISLWLAWRRRDVLSRLPVRPVPWLLLPIAVLCLLWLMGELAAVGAASQFALVGLIILAVPALLGFAIARVLAFALLFLLFAVPFGEFAVPRMMAWTADFTVMVLRFVGIPVYREGLEFIIPSGHWSVVEACSGVRYLIASFMIGTLYAYLTYRMPSKRLLFMTLSIVVPIIANWLRAVVIVLIGHVSGNRLATGADHLIYGWVFFGVVIIAMFMIGARWADDEDSQQPALLRPIVSPRAGPSAQAISAVSASGVRIWASALGIVALMLGTQVWYSKLEQPRSSFDGDWALPGPPSDWSGVDVALPWAPGFADPSAVAARAFEREGRTVWIWAAFYRTPGSVGRLVSSRNAVVAANDKQWAVVDEGIHVNGASMWRAATIREGSASSADGRRLRVWQAYWVAGRWVTGDAAAKLSQAAGRLLQGDGDGAVLMMATSLDTRADEVLGAFARDHAGTLSAALSQRRSLEP
jgi:exosortase A